MTLHQRYLQSMKILALAHERTEVDWARLAAQLDEEAAAVWQLCRQGLVREIYFTADTREAVMMLECAAEAEARRALDGLPLVRGGWLEFELRPLAPYTGFERLFRETV